MAELEQIPAARLQNIWKALPVERRLLIAAAYLRLWDDKFSNYNVMCGCTLTLFVFSHNCLARQCMKSQKKFIKACICTENLMLLYQKRNCKYRKASESLLQFSFSSSSN